MPKRSLPKSKPKPRIFISHSSHEPEAEKVRDALVGCLKRDFDVKIDKDFLVAGDDFRERIFNWINRAHGAVILFSSSALESPWVRTEAGILASRQTIDKTGLFKLIPVLLSPVTRADIETKAFSPMRLATLQLVRSDDHVQICTKVRAGLQPLLKPSLPDTPFERLVRIVASLLEKVRTIDLQNAAYAMDIDVSDWTEERDYPTLLGREMLERGLQQSIKGIREFDDFLGPDDTEKLIELVAPVWVSIPAASAIPQIATGADNSSRRVWVNGGDEHPVFTSEHFVRRACCRPPESSWPVLPALSDGGEDDVERYKNHILASVTSRLLREESPSERLVKDTLKRRDEDGEPVFVAFHPPGPDPDVLAALRTEFPTVTFFILAGNQTSAVPSSSPVEVQFLEPKLRAGEEFDAYVEYKNALSYLRKPGRV